MADITSMLSSLGHQLARRSRLERTLDMYYSGQSPLPILIQQAKITNAYRMLMGMSTAPWASLIVDSVDSRLEITGVNSGDKAIDTALWDIWQDNMLDAESQLVHKSTLIGGRSYGMVWPNEDGDPEISFDNMGQMVVKYQEGSRRKRLAAMRYWFDDETETPNANLYTPDGIYKFQGEQYVNGPDNVDWTPRIVPGEEWPVANPYNVVPVVEFNVNRRLKPGVWGHAQGEYENFTSLLDRINLLTFLGLIVSFWMGFPIRAVIGDTILRDDNEKLLPPFNVMSDEVVQFENPDVKLTQFDAADRSTLSIAAELEQLAALSKTPLTAFALSGSVSNISADALRALETGLASKVVNHKATLGEAWEELLRIGGLMLDTPVEFPPEGEVTWADHENRSLSERADAAVKLSTILPTQAILENILDFTSEQIERIQVQQASDTISQLLKSAATPQVAIQPQPAPGEKGPQNPMMTPPASMPPNGQ